MASYKGVAINPGTDAQVAAQVAAIDAQGATPPTPVTEPKVGSVYGNLGLGTYDSTPDQTINAALKRASVASATAPDERSIYKAKLSQYQGEIDAVNKIYAQKLIDSQQQGLGNLGSGRAIQARSGLLGSDFASAQNDQINQKNNEANNLVQQEQAAKIASIMGLARSDAADELKAKREAQSKGTADYITYLAKKTDRMSENAKKVASALLAQGINTDKLDDSQLTDIAKTYGISISDIATQYQALKKAKDDATRTQALADVKAEATYDPKTGTYTSTKKADPVSVGQGSSLVDPETGRVIYNNPKADPNADSAVPGYSDQFAATIANASSTGTTINQRNEIAQNLKTFIANGDYKSAATAINHAVYNSLQGAAQTDFTNKTNALNTTADLKKALQGLADAGYDTSKLTGAADKVQTKLGILTTDPKYAAVATQANLAFQNYRQQMTGAAFGPQESAEYASVLPSSGNTLSLNLAKIDGLTSYLQSVRNSYIKQTVGDGGVYINDYANGAKAGQAPASTPPPTEQEMTQLRSLFPGYTDDQIIQEATGGGSGKVSVGNTTASVQIPQTSHLAYVNNNPGNLRFAGQSGAQEGTGGFAHFSSAAEGFAALVNQIKTDTHRGLALAGFVHKYAPPTENDTAKYLSDVVALTGAAPNTPLSQINPVSLAKAIAKKESSTTLV